MINHLKINFTLFRKHYNREFFIDFLDFLFSN